MLARRSATLFVLSGLLVLSFAGPVQATVRQPTFTTQQVELPPLQESHVFVISGRSTSSGCLFTYPELRLPAGELRWEVRDIGVDIATCTKLVEEGLPPSQEVADNSLTTISTALHETQIANGQPLALPSVVTHSGYASARFENIFGQTLTKDTTQITWGISSGCVTAGSVYGNWSWNSVYYSLVSNSGSEDRTCSREHGNTWSSYRNNISGCTITFTAVNAYGWNDGTMSGNRNDSAQCSPVWEHFDVVQTT
jgi:hypothetical protein